jgi:hypothetical protein
VSKSSRSEIAGDDPADGVRAVESARPVEDLGAEMDVRSGPLRDVSKADLGVRSDGEGTKKLRGSTC